VSKDDDSPLLYSFVLTKVTSCHCKETAKN
jgi:hypothetical protein